VGHVANTQEMKQELKYKSLIRASNGLINQANYRIHISSLLSPFLTEVYQIGEKKVLFLT